VDVEVIPQGLDGKSPEFGVIRLRTVSLAPPEPIAGLLVKGPEENRNRAVVFVPERLEERSHITQGLDIVFAHLGVPENRIAAGAFLDLLRFDPIRILAVVPRRIDRIVGVPADGHHLATASGCNGIASELFFVAFGFGIKRRADHVLDIKTQKGGVAAGACLDVAPIRILDAVVAPKGPSPGLFFFQPVEGRGVVTEKDPGPPRRTQALEELRGFGSDIYIDWFILKKRCGRQEDRGATGSLRGAVLAGVWRAFAGRGTHQASQAKEYCSFAGDFCFHDFSPSRLAGV